MHAVDLASIQKGADLSELVEVSMLEGYRSDSPGERHRSLSLG